MKILARTPRNRAAGFTLIELMIAIAIIGVLAAIAVPAFTNYLARARVSEAINYAQACKTGYLESYATTGVLPTTAVIANCPAITTNNIANVAVSDNPAAIRITLANTAVLPTAIQGHVIVLQALRTGNARVDTNGQIIETWLCALQTGQGGVAAQAAMDLVPTICRNAMVTT